MILIQNISSVKYAVLCYLFDLFYRRTVDGIAVIAVSICCTVCIYRISSKQFGGMSGDLSGFFLQYSELALLAVIIVFQKVGLL